MILGNFWNPGVAVRRRPVSLCQGGIVASGPQCRCYTKEVVGATLEISRMKTKWVSKHWLFVTCSYFFTHLCCFFPHSSSSSPCFASCSLRVSLEPAGGVGVFQIWWAPVVWALELIEKGSRNPWNPYNRNYQEPQVPHPQTWIYIYICCIICWKKIRHSVFISWVLFEAWDALQCPWYA